MAGLHRCCATSACEGRPGEYRQESPNDAVQSRRGHAARARRISDVTSAEVVERVTASRSWRFDGATEYAVHRNDAGCDVQRTAAGHAGAIDGYASIGDAPALKNFASDLIPTVTAHLNMAKGPKA